jgi:protein-disulfide isomerase
MNTRLFILLGAFLVLAAGSLVLVKGQNNAPPLPEAQPTTTAAESVAEVESAAGDAAAPSEEKAEETPVTAAATNIDVQAALSDRGMGNPDAPVKIQEFASLTCSHCADFYTTTFPALKEKYIDTGKVYFVYRDFPLNAPALEASMVARCLPESAYFRFVKFLFSTQDQWAFGEDYQKYLKENSKLLGLNEDSFNACLANLDLKNGLGNAIQTMSEKYKIDSTPTFIINEGEKKLQGAQPIEVFDKALQPLLEGKAG